MKKIIVVTHGYPNRALPNHIVFLKELVAQWLDMGIEVKVINPQWGKFYRINKEDSGKNGVFFPKFYECRFLRALPFLHSIQRRISFDSFYCAVESIVDQEENKEDIILYSHFLNSGYIVAKLAAKYGIPAYCAVGESSLWTMKDMDHTEMISQLKNIRGFISVSSANSDLLIKNGIADKERIRLFPNGIDQGKFYVRNKYLMRQKLNLPENEIIGIFVGSFIERKGVLRVCEASKGIPNLKMIYIGKGEQQPVGDNIIFQGGVDHDLIPEYLSAADFFVLPTLSEGCCNAIIEAMACGLPVISSDGSFNDDILDENMSIRIAPMNIEQIRKAIELLVSNKELRSKMSDAAVKKAEEFDVTARAQRIIKYMSD